MKPTIYKIYILIFYWLNSETGTQVSGDIWDDTGHTGCAHMPRWYHTGAGGYPNSSDAEPERQHDILTCTRISTYAQAAESGLYTFFHSLISFRFR